MSPDSFTCFLIGCVIKAQKKTRRPKKCHQISCILGPGALKTTDFGPKAHKTELSITIHEKPGALGPLNNLDPPG